MGKSSSKEELQQLRRALCDIGPFARGILGGLAERLIPPGLIPQAPSVSKTFNDPIWKTIIVEPNEVCLLDLPLMQRLRRVRQLGLAYLVFPSAHHTRFEHSLGALYVANRVFSRFSDQVSEADRKKLGAAVRSAALLHDCGHTAFSHVGERALLQLPSVQREFSDIRRTLIDKFHDDLREEIRDAIGGRTENTADLTPQGPQPAELISVLLTLSESMEGYAAHLGIQATDLLRIASLIMGRPYGFGMDTLFPDFVKSIVSGDLDADKLDYVERDAYFSGVPIAADVERLISQLSLIKHRATIAAAEQVECLILGVKPSGVSAYEMFVMTRSYMFSRVYQHPKVRVAERKLLTALTAELKNRLGDTKTPTDDQVAAALGLLFGANGDDACSGDIDRSLATPGSTLSTTWRGPKRVLALSPQNVLGFDEKNGQSTAQLHKVWTKASSILGQRPHEIEKEIAELLGVEPSKVIIDWQRAPIIKENPAFFIDDQYNNGRLIPISKAFDIGQLAKAYENVKSLAWVFVEDVEPPKAAAAAAIVMTVNFGITPLTKAVTEAKVNPSMYRRELVQLGKAKGGLIRVAAQDAERALEGGLVAPKELLTAALALGTDAEVKAFQLAEEISKLKLPLAHFTELSGALTVLRYILEFVSNTKEAGPVHDLTLDEAEFQKEVNLWFRHAFRNASDISIEREAAAPSGRMDLLVSTGRNIGGRVVVELKAEEARFETSVKNNKEQAFSYLKDERVGRFGILFCRYRANDPRRQSDLIKLEINENGASKTVLFCVGQNVPRASASALKREAKPKTPVARKPRAAASPRRKKQ